MPRDTSGVYSKPAGTTAEANTVIASATFNSVNDDFVQDANTDRPVSAGGTGASTAEAARDNLGLTLQSSPSDGTSGRVLVNGAHGLGRSTPELTVADALDNLQRTGWNYVSAENALAVGGPAAVKGIAWTGITSSGRYQIYRPIEGDNLSPWRRVSEDGATYVDWLRDLDFAVTATGTWERRASGRQEIRHAPATFIFSTTRILSFVWTYPVAFSGIPHVTATFRNSDSTYNGFSADSLGLFTCGTGLTTGTCQIRRAANEPNFISSDTITDVSLHATGPWE